MIPWWPWNQEQPNLLWRLGYVQDPRDDPLLQSMTLSFHTSLRFVFHSSPQGYTSHWLEQRSPPQEGIIISRLLPSQPFPLPLSLTLRFALSRCYRERIVPQRGTMEWLGRSKEEGPRGSSPGSITPYVGGYALSPTTTHPPFVRVSG